MSNLLILLSFCNKYFWTWDHKDILFLKYFIVLPFHILVFSWRWFWDVWGNSLTSFFFSAWIKNFPRTNENVILFPNYLQYLLFLMKDICIYHTLLLDFFLFHFFFVSPIWYCLNFYWFIISLKVMWEVDLPTLAFKSVLTVWC